MEEPTREMKLLATTDKIVVGIVEFKGQIILATSDGVYRLEGDTFKPLRFENEQPVEIYESDLPPAEG